ncbi:MAG: glycosyltransferase [Planctomycetota bacterium]|nr:MAG: glycosyltransferase [Planctomycetota bacterium]
MTANPESSTGAPGAPPAPRLDVTVVIPISHPRAEVPEVVLALGAELDRLQRSWECILVYDGIRGPLWEVGLALQESTGGQVRTIALHRPFGESVCLASAFEHAHGEVIITAPQYLQVDPREIGRLLAGIDDGADLVTSWRSPRVDAWLNRVQSKLFNLVMRRIVGTQFHDLNCPFRAFRREVLEHLSIYGDMYRYLPAIAFKQGFRVDEVKVRHLKELGGARLYGIGVYARRLLDILGVMFLTKFTHKPLRFFGALGALLMAIGGVISGGLFVQWLLDHDSGLYQRPLFLVGILLFVLGVQVIGFGLVGEIIIFTQARNLREYRIERGPERVPGPDPT